MPVSSILISGLGIAGPTLAYWLIRHGFKPTLVERARQPRSGGYVIDFWGLGYEVAERMGLLPELHRHGYDVKDVRFVDEHGRRAGGFAVDVFRKLTHGRYVSLRRSDLARLIYRTIEHRCECLFGDSIVAIEQSDDVVSVGFEHAPARQFDLVIGADGLHSAVRRLSFGSQDKFEKYLGYAVAAFEIDGYRPRDERAYVSYSLPGKQVARFAMRDDRTVFLFVFSATKSPAADPHDIRAQKAVLHREFDGAGWECPQIMAALDACEDLYFDRVSQIEMTTWWRERVALTGDAAFCPSLLAGQGAALAMVSAYVLAGELALAPSEHARAFGRYQDRLYSFIADKHRAARQFARTLTPDTRFGLFVRNQVTKAFSIPFVAEFALGRDLFDRLELPNYPTDGDNQTRRTYG